MKIPPDLKRAAMCSEKSFWNSIVSFWIPIFTR